MNWRLGVVGYPIEHSLTPRLHEVALDQFGLTGTSERVALRESEAARLGEMMASRFDALSVTMPLKAAAAGVCDELDETATRLGVVNSLLASRGRVMGASTDGPGFLDALRAQFDLGARGLRVGVWGAGGAARGIVDALANAGASRIAVTGRTRANVDWLVSRYGCVSGGAVGPGALDLVVNTVPVDAREAPRVEPGVSAATVCVDVTYEPRLTPWRAAHAELGCRGANGLGMLAYQAARQLSWWWGLEVDGAALLKAIS